ncbi:MAG: hypothetical protein FWD38_00315 [Oscillospiraceae bacterium]|nr:hypothetical protein [Oscillospiraceae bacterium]
MLNPLLKDVMDLVICSGKRVLGKATLHNFEYESSPHALGEPAVAEVI